MRSAISVPFWILNGVLIAVIVGYLRSSPAEYSRSGSEMPGPYEQFILFGDSLTQFSSDQERGFASQPALQHAFMRRLDVINRGLSGYNTSQGLIALPEFMPTPSQAKVRFFHIWFGANDAAPEGGSSRQHVPLPEYLANLQKIIEHPTVQAHNPHIFLITPPPVDEYLIEQAWGGEIARYASLTKMYADACKELGTLLKVPVLDLWTAMASKTGWKEGDEKIPGSKDAPEPDIFKEFFIDGVHFKPPAYHILYTEIMELIKREWPHDSVTLQEWPTASLAAEPFVLPPWSEAPGLLSQK